MKRGIVGLAVLGLLLLSPAAQAGTISVSAGGRPTTASESGVGKAPVGSFMHTFSVTTDSDILSISNVSFTGAAQLYQNALNGDVEPPNPAFVAVFPELGVDSWISTPGGTSSAGGGFASDDATWFDSDSTGPAVNFQFATLTLPPGLVGVFKGNINTVGPGGSVVDSFAFEFRIPEPTSLGLAGFGMLAALVARRRNA
jgi:hypothetical protein